MDNKKDTSIYINTNILKWYQKIWYRITKQYDKLIPKWELLGITSIKEKEMKNNDNNTL